MAKSENSSSVTEAASFIGSRSVRAILAETGDRLVALDALTYTGNRPNVTDLEEGSRYCFEAGHIVDPGGQYSIGFDATTNDALIEA